MPRKTTSLTSDLRLMTPFWDEPVERTVLPNGLTAIIKPDSSAALASVQVWVKSGSIHEGANLGSGLSHFLEHMLFKGTTRRAGREISATVQAHGGYINAYTTFDRTVYYIDLPSEHVEVAIDLLADAVFHSTLPLEEVEKERNVILREIDMGRDDPDQRLSEALFETAFHQHPYRLPIIGHRNVFAAASREELLDYYRARYVPNNTVVTIVGDVGTDHARSLIEKHFGVLPRQKLAPVLVPMEEPPLAPRSCHLFEDVEVTRAGLGWQIPGITHPDTPFLDLLAMVLGNGDSAVLWQEVREKARLVHSIDANSWNPGSVGLFYISFLCDPDKREAATRAIMDSIHSTLNAGFKASQIRKAIRQLVVAEINSRKTMSGQASRLGTAEVVVGDLKFAEEYFNQLKAATSAQLVRVARTYLVPAHLTSVSLNPRKHAPLSAPTSGKRAGIVAFEEKRLANGARLLWQKESRLPNIHLRLLVRGGVAHQPAGMQGAASLLATLMTKDAGKYSASAVARRIESVGGSFSAFAGNNVLSIGVECLPPDFDLALDILRNAVLEPRFKTSTFEVERDAQLAELKQDADDIVTFARKELRHRFFGTHPLGLDSRGNVDGLAALTIPVVRDLYEKLFVSENAVLAVAGDLSGKMMLHKLERFLASLRSGPAPEIESEFPGVQASDNIRVIQEREQAVVLQGFPGPGILSPDFYVGEVADELFSGMSSVLFERVREEKGLAYFVRSTRVMGVHSGMFSFLAGTSPAHASEVLAEFDAEVRRVAAGGVDPAELLRCQVRIKAAKRQAMQTNGSRAMQAAMNAMFGQPINDWQEFDRRIDAVSMADLAEFAKRRLNMDQRIQLTVGP